LAFNPFHHCVSPVFCGDETEEMVEGGGESRDSDGSCCSCGWGGGDGNVARSVCDRLAGTACEAVDETIQDGVCAGRKKRVRGYGKKCTET
jgi:hypothetical protein